MPRCGVYDCAVAGAEGAMGDSWTNIDDPKRTGKQNDCNNCYNDSNDVRQYFHVASRVG